MVESIWGTEFVRVIIYNLSCACLLTLTVGAMRSCCRDVPHWRFRHVVFFFLTFIFSATKEYAANSLLICSKITAVHTVLLLVSDARWQS
jgi:hypothetical protein